MPVTSSPTTMSRPAASSPEKDSLFAEDSTSAVMPDENLPCDRPRLNNSRDTRVCASITSVTSAHSVSARRRSLSVSAGTASTMSGVIRDRTVERTTVTLPIVSEWAGLSRSEIAVKVVPEGRKLPRLPTRESRWSLSPIAAMFLGTAVISSSCATGSSSATIPSNRAERSSLESFATAIRRSPELTIVVPLGLSSNSPP